MSYEQAVKIWAADFLNRKRVYQYGQKTKTWTVADIWEVNFGGMETGYCVTCEDFLTGRGITINDSVDLAYDWEDLGVANLPELIDRIREFDPDVKEKSLDS